MTPHRFRTMLRRCLPYPNIVVQCDGETTPEHLRPQGMVCAIVTWCPEQTEDGTVMVRTTVRELSPEEIEALDTPAPPQPPEDPVDE